MDRALFFWLALGISLALNIGLTLTVFFIGHIYHEVVRGGTNALLKFCCPDCPACRFRADRFKSRCSLQGGVLIQGFSRCRRFRAKIYPKTGSGLTGCPSNPS